MRVYRTKTEITIAGTTIKEGSICVAHELSPYVCFSPKEVVLPDSPLGLPVYLATYDFFTEFVDEVSDEPECYLRAIEINEEYLDIENGK